MENCVAPSDLLSEVFSPSNQWPTNQQTNPWPAITIQPADDHYIPIKFIIIGAPQTILWVDYYHFSFLFYTPPTKS